jgi:hypothetical protein
MNANAFSIFFVLKERKFSKKGYIYNQQISLQDPKQFFQQFERWKNYLAGGYCFVINNRIWNARRAVLYDPHEVYCDVDSLDYALTFLESIVDCLPSTKEVECSLLEMVIVKSRYEDDRTLSLVGKAANGSVMYKKITVRSSIFFEALSDATDEYLQFAEALSGYIERSELPRERTKRMLLRKLQLQRWVAAADRLRRIVAAIRTN